MEKLNNPHVYPSTQIDWNESVIQNRTVYVSQEEGITLRDEFANSAMQTLVSKRDTSYDIRGRDTYINTTVIAELARHSYQIADAMLRQREK
jgi:hypothetical protein